MRHPESQLQISCLRYFRYQYSNIARLIFSIPNGGYRRPIEAKIMKAEGAVSGTSDVIFLIPSGIYSSLCIEFKAPGGKQTDLQKSWQELAEKHGNKYVIVRSFDAFRTEIQNYLSQKLQ